MLRLERALIITLLCGSATLAQTPREKVAVRANGAATSPALKSGAVSGPNGGAAAGAVRGPRGAHAAGAAIWKDADGNLRTGHVAGTAFNTENGTGVAGRAGSATINRSEGTASSRHAGGIATSEGRAASYRQQGESAWDEDSYSRHSEGQVDSAGGQGATWTRDVAVEQTGDGYTRTADTQVETNQGDTYDLNRSRDVSRTEEGYARTVTGQATRNQGRSDEQSATWSRDLKAKREAEGASVKRQGAGSTSTGRSGNHNVNSQFKRDPAAGGKVQRSGQATTGGGRQRDLGGSGSKRRD